MARGMGNAAAAAGVSGFKRYLYPILAVTPRTRARIRYQKYLIRARARGTPSIWRRGSYSTVDGSRTVPGTRYRLRGKLKNV
jgi:hypothetical protein